MPVMEVISTNCGAGPAQASPALRCAGDCSLDISALKTKSARRSAVQLCQTGRFIGFQGEHLNLRFPAECIVARTPSSANGGADNAGDTTLHTVYRRFLP